MSIGPAVVSGATANRDAHRASPSSTASRTRRRAVERRAPAGVAGADGEALDLVPGRVELDDRAVARIGDEGVAAGQALDVAQRSLGDVVGVVADERGRERARLVVQLQLDADSPRAEMTFGARASSSISGGSKLLIDSAQKSGF